VVKLLAIDGSLTQRQKKVPSLSPGRGTECYFSGFAECNPGPK